MWKILHALNDQKCLIFFIKLAASVFFFLHSQFFYTARPLFLFLTIKKILLFFSNILTGILLFFHVSLLFIPPLDLSLRGLWNIDASHIHILDRHIAVSKARDRTNSSFFLNRLLINIELRATTELFMCSFLFSIIVDRAKREKLSAQYQPLSST